MLLLVSRLVFCRSNVTSVCLHHTHMREHVDICIGISWSGREQNADNQQQCSQSYFAFLKRTFSVFTWFVGLQSTQATPLLLRLLFLMACVAAVLCELLPVPQRPAGSSEPYLPRDRHDMKRKRAPFLSDTCFCSEILVLGSVRPVILTLFVRSGLWFLSVPAPFFGCFVFKICDFIPTLEWCFMYSKSQIQTLLNMSSVSGKLISLITNKAGNRSFFLAKEDIWLLEIYF